MNKPRLRCSALGLLAVCSFGLSSESLHDIAGGVKPDRLRADVETLVGFGTRHTLSDTESELRGIGAARRWIQREFEAIGAGCAAPLEVTLLSEVVSGPRIPKPTEIVNVIAIQRGTLDPDRVVMMTADIDSRVSDVLNATADSPGANDNASGMAATLEAARVLCKHTFAGTIVYAGLSGEEQGLYGGKILASHAQARNWRVMGVLNNDMVGNISGINGVINNTTARVFSEGTRALESEEDARQRRYMGGELDSPSRNIARLVDRLADRYIPNLDVKMIYRLDRFGRGGHHIPLNEAGFPAVRIMETNEHYDRQHQDLRIEEGREYGDTIAYVDFDYAAKLTALNAITLASMAGAPPFPANVRIAGAVSADTTLSWSLLSDRDGRVDASNLASFRIHWRETTDPQWSFSRTVDATERAYTLNNIVIDNYFFGVSSVSVEGYESPVVFPFVMGAFESTVEQPE